MNRTAALLFALALCAGWQPYCAASGSFHKQSPNAASGREQIASDSDEKWERDPITFTTHDRSTILNYYRGMTLRIPSGPGDKRGLKLSRNIILPVNSQIELESLSNDLERRLQPLYS